MKVTFSIITSFFLFFLSLTIRADNIRELVILNWADYMPVEIITEFEQRHQVKIREVYYESDEDRTQVLVNSNGRGYDLIMVSGGDLLSYSQFGFLAPIQYQKLENYKHLEPRWLSAHEGAAEYALPFFWGTLGIAYRKDLLDTAPNSWLDIFKPDKALQGRIAMMADGGEILRIALKALGYSVNSETPKELKEAQQLALAQKAYVKAYQYIQIDASSELVSGEIWASMAYNGDAIAVQEYSDNIAFVVPEEGTYLWVDYWTLAAKAKEPELAYQFLDFISRPDIAVRLAQAFYFASPNRSAAQLLPADFLSDPAIYPPQEIIEKSELYQQLSPKAVRRRNIISRSILQ